VRTQNTLLSSAAEDVDVGYTILLVWCKSKCTLMATVRCTSKGNRAATVRCTFAIEEKACANHTAITWESHGSHVTGPG
jgi:hypothetical protein